MLDWRCARGKRRKYSSIREEFVRKRRDCSLRNNMKELVCQMEKSFYEKKNSERIGLSGREEFFSGRKIDQVSLFVRKRKVGYAKIIREEICLSKRRDCSKNRV